MLEFFTVVIIVIGWLLMGYHMDDHPVACFLIPAVIFGLGYLFNYFNPFKSDFFIFIMVCGALLIFALLKRYIESWAGKKCKSLFGNKGAKA